MQIHYFRSLLSTIHGHTHWVTSLSLHPTMPYLLSSSLDGSARLWDYSRCTLWFARFWPDLFSPQSCTQNFLYNLASHCCWYALWCSWCRYGRGGEDKNTSCRMSSNENPFRYGKVFKDQYLLLFSTPLFRLCVWLKAGRSGSTASKPDCKYDLVGAKQ